MNEVYQTILARRSVRSYQMKKVAAEDAELILSAAIHAPNGLNRQCWHFSAISDQDKLDMLRLGVRDFFRTVELTDAMPPFFKFFQQTAKEKDVFSFFHNAPLLVIASSMKGYPNGSADCAAAVENMLLMATSLGLGSCYINTLTAICDFPAIREQLTALGIPESHAVCSAAAIGFTSGEVQQQDRTTDCISWI